MPLHEPNGCVGLLTELFRRIRSGDALAAPLLPRLRRILPNACAQHNRAVDDRLPLHLARDHLQLHSNYQV